MTVDSLALTPGSTVGSYRIVGQIGSGGMGAVFEARHSTLSRHVAIKVLHGQLLGQVGMDERMLQEASILDELRHPGIVRVLDCGLLPDRRPWIAMELVGGESLATRLGREKLLAPAAVCTLLGSLAEVLASVHSRGIIHRDLKPDNILFDDAETGFPLRIIDWGVARLGPAARLTPLGVTCGTPIYMSPEQATGRNIAAPCDIYSIGVIAYEALAGHAPFEGQSLVEVVTLHLHGAAAPLAPQCPTAPRALCDLIHQMLSKTPAARPSALEVRRRVTEIAAELESHEATSSPDRAVASELDPLLGRPRWTPEAHHVIPARWGNALIKPHSANCLVAGEFLSKH